MKMFRTACSACLCFSVLTHADEGRMEVSQGDIPLTITASGSYILTGNISGAGVADAVTINASHVTFDLNGFSMTGTGGFGDAIALGPSVENVTLRNGIIRSWTGSGIDGVSGNRCVYYDLLISDNLTHGLDAGARSHIYNVTSSKNNGDGIRAAYSSIVRHCMVQNNGADGSGSGIVVTESCIVLECITSDNATTEIDALRRNRIERNLCDCNGDEEFAPPVDVGIDIQDDDNLVRDNHVTGCSTAYNVGGFDANDNIVVANTSSDSITDFDISSGNTAGEETTDIASTNNVNSGHGFMNIRQ